MLSSFEYNKKRKLISCVVILYRQRPWHYLTVKSINQLIKIYIAPLEDPYSEALPTQAKRKRTVLRMWWN